jgi:CPA1 family monovalent cation:H+ antiporter
MRKANIPLKTEVLISSESLFNDGIGVVLFITIYEISQTGEVHLDWIKTCLLFGREVFGGIGLGLLFGFTLIKLIKEIDQYQTEVLLTIAFVMGLYEFCSLVHTSGPLAVVTAGLLFGTNGREISMGKISRNYLDKFWELIDEFLNVLLFVLVGVQMIVFTFAKSYWLLSAISILILLIARFFSVAIPAFLFRKKMQLRFDIVKLLTWGGLRGALSIAMALSLPESLEKQIILSCTYFVVVFSILVQGLTVGKLITKLKIN